MVRLPARLRSQISSLKHAAPVTALVTQRTHGEVTSPTEVTDLLTETRSIGHSAGHTADTW